MTNRLFIAADLSDQIKDNVIRIRNKIYGDGENIRWESKDKLHFTIKFLGDVEEPIRYNIVTELEKLLMGKEKINCTFNKFGLFKRDGIPSILWLGIIENKQLTELAGLVDSAMANLGFEKERRNFKAHLTLLRIKGREDLKKIYDFLEYRNLKIDFAINEIMLMKSELLKSGSIYEKIKSFNLI